MLRQGNEVNLCSRPLSTMMPRLTCLPFKRAAAAECRQMIARKPSIELGTECRFGCCKAVAVTPCRGPPSRPLYCMVTLALQILKSTLDQVSSRALNAAGMGHSRSYNSRPEAAGRKNSTPCRPGWQAGHCRSWRTGPGWPPPPPPPGPCWQRPSALPAQAQSVRRRL